MTTRRDLHRYNNLITERERERRERGERGEREERERERGERKRGFALAYQVSRGNALQEQRQCPAGADGESIVAYLKKH